MLIMEATTEVGKWVEDSGRLIAVWQRQLQELYVEWSVAVNGLEVASNRYNSPEWNQEVGGFHIRALRLVGPQRHDWTQVHRMTGPEAAGAHAATMHKLPTWGLIDYYAAFERFIFELYRLWHKAHPEVLCRGEENRELRRLKREVEAGVKPVEAWKTAWVNRLDSWQRHRLYDGLDKVFVAYMNQAGLGVPKTYKSSSVEGWGEVLSAIGSIRNTLIHGGTEVPDELVQFCQKPYSLGLSFKAGDKMVIDFSTFAKLELFSNQLLAALSISLAEHPDARK